MDSRERVGLAFQHKEPDRVPVSIGSNIVDGFTKFSKDNYEKYLGFSHTPYKITHKPMGTVITPQKILNMSGMDFRTTRLKAPWNNPSKVYEDGSYLDFVPAENIDAMLKTAFKYR